METFGLRELNQNPSKAVARVRAGASIVVTDRGKPVLRMITEAAHPRSLERMLATGETRAPVEQGMPDLIPELAGDVGSPADLLIAGRDRDRSR